MPSSYNISVNQGDAYSSIIIASGDSSALNLEGCSAEGKISVKAGSSSRLYNITGAVPDNTSGNAALGYLSISIPAEATSLMPVGIFPYDIDVSNGSTTVTAIKGKFIVNPGLVTPSQTQTALVEIYSSNKVLVTNNDGVAVASSVTSDQFTSLIAKNDYLLLKTKLITRETPSETPDGLISAFTLANSPVETTECVFLNGILQDYGLGNDYTLSNNSLVFNVAPQENDKIRINYYKL